MALGRNQDTAVRTSSSFSDGYALRSYSTGGHQIAEWTFQVGQQFFEIILKTASGQPSKSEIFGYGEDEFAPWVLGPTM